MEQSLYMQERNFLEIKGVKSVDSFDSNIIELTTVLGGLEIFGEQLKVGNLSLENGNLTISGTINALQYGEKSSKSRSKNMLSRLLK